MLRDVTRWLKNLLGIEEDIVAMAMLVLALGALAQVFAAIGKIIRLEVKA